MKTKTQNKLNFWLQCKCLKRTRNPNSKPFLWLVHLFLHSANQKYTKGFMTCQMFILYINKPQKKNNQNT